MSVTTSTVPTAWPTGDDFTRVLARLADGYHAIDEITAELGRLVDTNFAPSIEEGVPPPSLKTVGSIATFVACVELDAGVLLDNVDKLKKIRDAVSIETADRLKDDDDAR